MAEGHLIKCKVLYVWDAEAEPTECGEALIYKWSGYRENGSVRSVLSYVESNSDRLRSKYLAFVYELGESKLGNKH